MDISMLDLIGVCVLEGTLVNHNYIRELVDTNGVM